MALAGDVDALRVLAKREHAAIVLDQHQRFADAIASHGPVLGGTEGLVQRAVGQLGALRVHHAHRELGAENARDGVIDARPAGPCPR